MKENLELATKINDETSLIHTNPRLASSLSPKTISKKNHWYEVQENCVCRVELVGFKHRCGQAKIIGLSACVSGAILMTFYKGPPLLRLKSGPPTLLLAEHPRDFLDRLLVVRMLATLGLVFDTWKLGALCLVGNTLCLGTFINIQVCNYSGYPN